MNTMNAVADVGEVNFDERAGKASPVSEALLSLTVVVSGLRDTVDRFEQRLEPVLGTSYPTPDQSEADVPREKRGAVTESVLDAGAEVARLALRLRELESRLDV